MTQLKFQLRNLPYLEDMPLNNGSSGIFQNLFPVFKSRLVGLLLIPSKLNLSNRLSATNQVIVTNLQNDFLKFVFTYFILYKIISLILQRDQ